ncbi:MAG: hypothetical protein IJE40_03065, partial [Clostridia bacterium]|nr:hypothetical protein [Clostridia bacterium]
LDRYDEVGKKYNINIVGKHTDDYGFDVKSLLTQLVIAGKSVPNLIDMHSNDVYDYYKSGMLYPLDEITTIDIDDEKWGPQTFRTYGIFNERPYGFFPYEWENMPEYAGGLIYNIELGYSKGYDIKVHELKEQGQWTWDTFEDILQSLSSADDDISPLGIREGAYYFAKAAVFSNGGEVVSKDVNGKYVFALTDRKAVKALEWAQGLVNQDLVNLEDDTFDFVNGSSFFHACESYVATHSDDWMEGKYPAAVMNDYTFINMPTGPDADENTVSAYTHAHRRLFWVPSHGSLEFDILGLIIDEIFEPLEGSSSQAWREMSLNYMYIYEEGYEEFAFGVDNCNYDYTAQLNEVEEMLNDALDEIVSGGSITEQLSSIQYAVEEAIAKELNSN